jgi:hypothetical protein
MKPGRQNIEDKVITLVPNESRPRLSPCRRLTKAEQQVFNLACAENRHLRAIDTPLLTTFAIATAKTYTKLKVEDFDKLVRLSLAIARSLRLTQQSRTNPLTLSRAQQRGDRSYYERQSDD